LNQTVAELILTAVVDSWQHVGSLERREIISQSQERGKEFMDNAQVLIQADSKTPAADVLRKSAKNSF